MSCAINCCLRWQFGTKTREKHRNICSRNTEILRFSQRFSKHNLASCKLRNSWYSSMRITFRCLISSGRFFSCTIASYSWHIPSKVFESFVSYFLTLAGWKIPIFNDGNTSEYIRDPPGIPASELWSMIPECNSNSLAASLFSRKFATSDSRCARVDQQLPMLGMGSSLQPSMTGILIMGPYKPLLLGWWVYPLLYGNNGSLDPGTDEF